MPLKSILRAVGGFFMPRDMPGRARAIAELDRLTTRSDWRAGGTPLDNARLIDPNFPNPPAWTQNGPPQPIVTDGEGVDPNRPPSPPWPAHDDPYAKPEPCAVVPDAGLERITKLTERGLVVPFATKSDLSNVMDLIDRQEAAEKYLRKIGMVWERGRGWHLP